MSAGDVLARYTVRRDEFAASAALAGYLVESHTGPTEYAARIPTISGTGSGIGMIDRAALQTVQDAHYPQPPEDMRGSDRLYQVWVEFSSQ